VIGYSHPVGGESAVAFEVLIIGNTFPNELFTVKIAITITVILMKFFITFTI
jgi:hypothetical protein